ncbi:threonine synthase [Agathobaculum sp. NTUH-O15-33]|uniref:threonine synthase n=1 Tax=Agathobaculum sp. NTUH-O15-33 TaxID=3079302 RepID=UPI002958D0C6|nr:threonine synthase [Agathobaculum sp. NTUH-O15-33]WNX83623.1 threonine synthase [Agathobaculum sp. NTUH-O15-33]
MEYVSTRDKSRAVSSAYAIANGIAPDGGLYCPTEFPSLSAEDWHALAKMDYKGRAAMILGRFLTDFSAEELTDFAAKAYADEKFGGANTAPVVSLADGKHLLELWHGPTCAFKDMALQILPHLLTASLRKIGEKRTACILVATSGDTGKAALDGFADVPGTKIMVYYPENGVSPMQKLQMNTQTGENVEVVAIRGNFDDAQSAVKQIFTDAATREALDRDGMMLSSANSINWGRLAPQIAYYISAYCDLLAEGKIAHGDQINICVPTGNFGNILAAYIAKQMGLPVNKFICASNRNNVLTDFFKKGGSYDKNRAFYTTASPSMDILISSNLERLLFLASGQNDKLVAELMDKLGTEGRYALTAEMFSGIAADFDAGCCDDAETAETIRALWEKEHYLADTHTAVAVRVYEDYRARTGDETPVVIASTASPFKFCRSVIEALGGSLERDDVTQLGVLEQLTGEKAPAPLAALAGKTPRFDRVVDKEAIFQTIELLKAR